MSNSHQEVLIPAADDGLEVAYHDVPQVVYLEDSSQPEKMEVGSSLSEAANSQNDKPEKAAKTRDHRKICGIKTSTFWLVSILVLVIIIGAGVGGGVAGSRSRRANG